MEALIPIAAAGPGFGDDLREHEEMFRQMTEPAVLSLARIMLEQAGYEVVATGAVADASRAWECRAVK